MEAASLTKVTRHGQVTLPATIRRLLRIEEGDYVEMRVAEDSVVLTPKKLIDKNQAYFWTSEWQAAEREADEDITAGRIQQFDDVEDAIAHLHKRRIATP
jgi:AbrB family looped-hinge helix DNA binding protein